MTMNVVFIAIFGPGLIRTQKITTNVAFIVVFFARGQDSKKRQRREKNKWLMYIYLP